MHVLHVMSGYGGGISSFIANKAQALTAADAMQFSLVTFDECPAHFKRLIEATGGQVYRLPNPKKAGWRTFFKAYQRVYYHKSYDVVYCHIAGYRALVHWLLARRHHVPAFYIHAHTTLDTQGRKGRDQTFRLPLNQKLNTMMSRLPVGCSSEAILYIFGEGTDLDQTVTIPNSIEAEAFLKDETAIQVCRQMIRNRYPQTGERRIIAHIGRLTPVKNHAKTLEIAEVIVEKQLPWHILLFGSGELEMDLQAKIAQKGLGDVISLAGRLQPISDLYPAVDVLLLPSFKEGLPTVAIEGQAACVPMLLSDTISREADLKLGLLQYLSLAEPAWAWVRAIEQLMKTPTLSIKARRRALEETHFTNRGSLELFMQLIRGELTRYRLNKKAGERA